MALLKRKAEAPRPPEGTVVYAIGDIHGRLDLLNTLLDRIEEDADNFPGHRKVLVTLGDYVDRGENSRGVIDALVNLSEGRDMAGFETVTLLGNHEDMMLKFLENPAAGPLWIANGGDATLESYGISVDRDVDARLPESRSAFASVLPQEHLRFLRRLDATHVEGDYLFVHAGVRPGRPIAHQDPEDLIWIRDEFLQSKKDHGKVVVHGHSVAFEPEVFPERPRPSRIGIDTGAYMTGSLTCLVIEGENRRWLQTMPNERFA